jgi:DNA-binding PadR family transcriptional regulator
MDAEESPGDHPHHHEGSHRGWIRPGGRRGRWLEPFLLLLIAEGVAHGSAIIARLDDLCLTADGVDVGMAYRTLREFEAEGLVVSTWILDDGPPRRSYQLTDAGAAALEEWVAVMRERARLIETFLAMAGRGARDVVGESTEGWGACTA